MLLQELLDVVQRIAPRVALVLDEALQQRKRRDRAVAGKVLDGACYRNRVLEADCLREEAADLQLGIDAGMQTPVGLEQEPVAEHEHGVAALHAGGTHLTLPHGGVVAGELGKGGSAHKAYRSTRTANIFAGSDGARQRAAKVFVGKCVREHADATLLPYPGDSRVLHCAHSFVWRVFPDERQRKEIILRLAGGALGASQRDQPARWGVAPLHVIDQRDALEGLAFGRVPALRGDKCGQEIALELSAYFFR